MNLGNSFRNENRLALPPVSLPNGMLDISVGRLLILFQAFLGPICKISFLAHAFCIYNPIYLVKNFVINFK